MEQEEEEKEEASCHLLVRALRIQDSQVRVSHPDRPYYRRLIGIERETDRKR